MLAIIDGDMLVYMAAWQKTNLVDAKKDLHRVFDEALENMFIEDGNYAMAVGGPNNFRVDMYPEYKRTATRKQSKSSRPDWFEDLKSYLEDFPNTVVTDGFEADDQVRIWQQEAERGGVEYVIVSGDKDLDCIPGNHFDPKFVKYHNITEEYATRFFWYQMLVGDGVDNIPGARGIGPKKAQALLEPLSTEEEYIDAVCRAYYQTYGEEGYNNLLMNGKLIHIWRTYNDHFTLERSVYDAAVSV